MVRLRCKKACLNGSGNPNCKIRKCCQKKEIRGCWECEDFNTCKKFDILKPIHKDANLKNLKRIKKNGEDKFITAKRDW